MDDHEPDAVTEAEGAPTPHDAVSPGAPAMDDAALVAAIPGSSLADSETLAAEAGRRRLAAAAPALAALCHRFAGSGVERRVPEQEAALRALAMIGGRDAAHAVAEIIERASVQGAALRLAVETAARLHAHLSLDALWSLLRYPEPAIRAEACRCARPVPEVIALLVGLLDDPDLTVANAAACALGQMGRVEALPRLKILLRHEPPEEVIEAVTPVADEESLVLLGRIARSAAGPVEAALTALDSIDHPRAAVIAAAIRRERDSS